MIMVSAGNYVLLANMDYTGFFGSIDYTIFDHPLCGTMSIVATATSFTTDDK